jgi:hypothetical protein
LQPGWLQSVAFLRRRAVECGDFKAAESLADTAVGGPGVCGEKTVTVSVIFGGKTVGHLIAETDGNRTTVDYDYNGI